jgi:hypothetical protein
MTDAARDKPFDEWVTENLQGDPSSEIWTCDRCGRRPLNQGT